MKTTLTGLLLTLLLASCDPNADKSVGNADLFKHSNNNTGGGGSGTGGGGTGFTSGGGSSTTPTDAPIDGGVGILLIAGIAYGAKRLRPGKEQSL